MQHLVGKRNTTAFNEIVGSSRVEIHGSAPREPQDMLAATSAMVDSSPAGVARSLSDILQWANQYGAVPNHREAGQYLSDDFHSHTATAEEMPHAPFYKPRSHLALPTYSTIPDSSLPAIAAKTQYKDAESRSMSKFRASSSPSTFSSSRSTQLEPLKSVPQHHKDTITSKIQAVMDRYSRQPSGEEIYYMPPLLKKSSTPKSCEDESRAYTEVPVDPSLRNSQHPLTVRPERLLAGWRHCQPDTHVEAKEDKAKLIGYLQGRSLGLDPSPSDREVRGKCKAFEAEKPTEPAEFRLSGDTSAPTAFDEKMEKSQAQDPAWKKVWIDSADEVTERLKAQQLQAQDSAWKKAWIDEAEQVKERVKAQQRYPAEAHAIACKARILRDTQQVDKQLQSLWNKLTTIDRAEEARKKSWWPDQKAAKNNAESRKETLEELKKATVAAKGLNKKLRMMEMVEGARKPRTGAVGESESEKRAEGLLDAEDGWVWLEDDSYAMQFCLPKGKGKQPYVEDEEA